MQRLVVAIAVLCAVVSSGALVVARIVFPPPELVANASEHDFGELLGPKAASHAFRLKNKGGRTLRITGVRATCSCTEAAVGTWVLGPGEGTELRVGMDPGRTVGVASGRVIVCSNDPDNPEMVFSVQGRVSPRIPRLSPPLVDFGRLPLRSIPKRLEFTVLCQDENDLSISVADSLDVSPVHSRLVKTGGWPKLLVWLEPGASAGPLTGAVHIRTRSKTGPELRLAVRGEITGPVRAIPAAVRFGEVSAGPEMCVRVVSDRNSPFEASILEICGAGREFLAASLEPAGSNWELRVSLKPDQLRPSLSKMTSVVRIRCRWHDSCDLNVPVHAFAEGCVSDGTAVSELRARALRHEPWAKSLRTRYTGEDVFRR